MHGERAAFELITELQHVAIGVEPFQVDARLNARDLAFGRPGLDRLKQMGEAIGDIRPRPDGGEFDVNVARSAFRAFARMADGEASPSGVMMVSPSFCCSTLRISMAASRPS